LGSRAGFHPDQAARNVGEPALKLNARALQLQNDRPALIEADKIEAILAEVDADGADGGGWCSVKPFLKGHKNDYRDAEAIAEAVQRPTMHFVAIKTPEQMDRAR